MQGKNVTDEQLRPAGRLQRYGDIRNGPKWHELIVLRRQKTPTAPECLCVIINGIDDKRVPADRRSAIHAARQGLIEQAQANPLPNPCSIRRKLPEQNTGHRVGRLAGADRARQGGGHDPGRCQVTSPAITVLYMKFCSRPYVISARILKTTSDAQPRNPSACRNYSPRATE